MSVILLGVVLSLIAVGQVKRRQTMAVRALEEANLALKKDNLKLEEASSVDALTGLKNRYSLGRDYMKFLNRAVYVMVLDIDDFKQVNDTLGHRAGDELLEKVGKALINIFGVQACYRYGGDEFLVICSEMDRDRFLEKSEQVKQRFSQIQWQDSAAPLHLSAGFVYGITVEEPDLDSMIRQADGYMYQAKHNGKNCIVGEAFAKSTQSRKEEDCITEAK